MNRITADRRHVVESGTSRPVVCLLTTSHSYRSPAFMTAAEQLDIEVIPVIDAPQVFSGWNQGTLYVDFQEPDKIIASLKEFSESRPLKAVLAVDDAGSLAAAKIAAELGLPHNAPRSALAARDKWEMRQALLNGGMRGPQVHRFSTQDEPAVVAAQVRFPCVIKPLRRSGSQGVIRVDNPGELKTAMFRLSNLLVRIEPQIGEHFFLIEDYLPGREFALEGLLDQGQLHVLALFDKPDPLEGPYFEETIYVTPSRLNAKDQQALIQCAAEAAAILGLRQGPLHAEMRLNKKGAWILEVAGRSIGGLCSQVLRFGVDVSLEELILRQAVGYPLPALEREGSARGVMMIPIPAGGLLRGVHGVEAAELIPGIEKVTITTPLNNWVTPLPEGESYLGFIFARGDRPENVENALRGAHEKLNFDIQSVIELKFTNDQTSL